MIDLIDHILYTLESEGRDVSDWRRDLAILMAGGAA